MPRFSIKDLMLATTAVVVGIAAVLISRDAADFDAVPLLSLRVIGFSLVGAGFLYPFGRGGLGWVGGFVLGVLSVGLEILLHIT